MQHSWSFLEELVAASQRWYVVVAFILVGALLGAGVALVIPGPYRATSDLYVGLDVYRAMRDLNIPIRPAGANDYKNWQMEDLKLVMTSIPVLNRTLDLLRIEDGYWSDINKRALLEMLDLYWRNAGRWRMVAYHPEEGHARQAVTAWKIASLEEVHEAIAQSREVLILDAKIQALSAKEAELIAQQPGNENGGDETNEIDSQLSLLASGLERLKADYATASANSWGLSTNLIVADLDDYAVEIRKIRPFGNLLLLGAVIGLITWLLYEVIMISRRKNDG